MYTTKFLCLTWRYRGGAVCFPYHYVGGSPPKTGAVLAASPRSATCYTDARDNVPCPIWTHLKVTDSKKNYTFLRVSLGMKNYTSQPFWICYQRECNLSTDQSTNWWGNDPLQRAIATFSVYDVNAYKEGHHALHPCRLASFPGTRGPGVFSCAWRQG